MLFGKDLNGGFAPGEGYGGEPRGRLDLHSGQGREGKSSLTYKGGEMLHTQRIALPHRQL